MPQRASLRLRLALWLLLPLSVFVAICGYLNWRNAAEVADYVQDTTCCPPPRCCRTG